MNLLLGIGDWLANNWILIVLIVLSVALLVPTYIRQKKDAAARSELASSLKKGVKVITTAGVYGVIESIESTTDGKVVTIKTGNDKNPSTMTIHINAIGGIDNKTAVVDNAEVEEKTDNVKKETVSEEQAIEDAKTEEIAEKITPKKKSTSKKTTSKK